MKRTDTFIFVRRVFKLISFGIYYGKCDLVVVDEVLKKWLHFLDF